MNIIAQLHEPFKNGKAAFDEIESKSSAKHGWIIPCQAEGSGEDVGMMAEDVGETDIEERKDLFLTVPLKQLQFGFFKVLTPHVIKSQVTGGESNGSNMDMSTVYEKAVGKCPVVTV